MRRTSIVHNGPSSPQQPMIPRINEGQAEHASPNIELDTFLQVPSNSRAPSASDGTQPQEFSLPPTDSGKDAWLVLVGAFLVEAAVWGLPFTFGVFQEYYSTLPQFEDQRAGINVMSTAVLGIMYLASPLSLLGLRQWPNHRRTSSSLGLAIVISALLSASYATRVWQLIVTQCVMYGIGGVMLYYPALLFVDEWFVRRKGLAYGIAWAATGLSGLAYPFFISWSLQKYSYGTTLRVLAVFVVIVTTPALFFLKPRLPVSATSRFGVPDMRFALKSPFLPCQAGNLLHSLGIFIPGSFLPIYVRSLGYGNVAANGTVPLLNGGIFMGCVIAGVLIDRYHVTNIILLAATGGTLSIALLWGLSNSVAALYVFALTYGLCLGGFSSTWPGIVQETQRQNVQVETGLAYAILIAGRGIGSIVSGPLSNALLDAKSPTITSYYGYGSGFGLLIAFAAASNAMGSIGFIARRLGW